MVQDFNDLGIMLVRQGEDHVPGTEPGMDATLDRLDTQGFSNPVRGSGKSIGSTSVRDVIQAHTLIFALCEVGLELGLPKLSCHFLHRR